MALHLPRDRCSAYRCPKSFVSFSRLEREVRFDFGGLAYARDRALVDTGRPQRRPCDRVAEDKNRQNATDRKRHTTQKERFWIIWKWKG